MKPIRTAETNHNFGAPLGHEEEIGNLPCKNETEHGANVVYSVWEPTAQERKAIADGYNLRIGVFGLGGGMVPISLGITHLTEEA